MIEKLLEYTSLVLLLVAIYLFVEAAFTRRLVKKSITAVADSVAAINARRLTPEQVKDVWIETQLERALALIESSNEDEILAGLQILSVMDKPEIQVKAFRRLYELTKHPQPNISRQAEVTIEMISNFAVS
jgi:hypothetical protein